ncbi:MAG: Tol-Pal system protein TolB [Geminicoccaceae bacterium]|nr:MAG: Tol-Pal system protein TolB [Geminicoccaceae bacterium]
MRTTRRQAMTSLAAVGALASAPAAGQLTVTIDRGTVRPLPIAVSPFAGGVAAQPEIGLQIAEVIGANLDRSGLFRTIDRSAYIQTPDDLADQGPRFADWRQINAEALVSGRVSAVDATNMAVEFRLFDVLTASERRGLRYTAPIDDWRRVAHKISDEIYSRITGESGYFDTRIVYVSETGLATQRVKRLAIMDQDGANHRFLTRGDSLVMTPRFAPDGETIAFLSFRTGEPQVALIDASGANDRLLGRFDGMTFAPRFSPDGQRLAMSLAAGGSTSLFMYDLRTQEMTRLTSGPHIDTSPSFSPDGGRLVFNSDRAGSPQLYVMDLGSGRAERISFGGGRYSTPAWSPRGDLVTFVNQQGGSFHVGLMRPDGGDERLITRSYLDDGPRFAPNGRVVVFERHDRASGRMRLFTIDVTGFNLREVATPLDATDPDWSPLRR